jgi:hypothetical protein
MRTLALALLSFSLCQAIRIPLRKVKRYGATPLLTPLVNAVVDDNDPDLDFKSVMDLVYMADITIG